MLLNIIITGMKVVCVKGSSEKILSMCFSTSPSSASFAELSHWQEQTRYAAAYGMRVLGVAYKFVPLDYELGDSLFPNSAVVGGGGVNTGCGIGIGGNNADAGCGFVLTCLVGIMDPPRPEAIVAIKEAQEAGNANRLFHF